MTTRDPMPTLTAYILTCPWTEACRARALAEFAALPELAARFATQPRCRDTDAARQRRCAAMLGLVGEEVGA